MLLLKSATLSNNHNVVICQNVKDHTVVIRLCCMSYVPMKADSSHHRDTRGTAGIVSTATYSAHPEKVEEKRRQTKRDGASDDMAVNKFIKKSRKF